MLLKNEDIERNIKTRLLSSLFEKKFLIYIASFSASLVYSYIIYDDRISYRMAAWIFAFVIYLGLRYSMTSYYRTHLDEASNDPYKFENYNMYVAIYGGALWGISSVLYFPVISTIKILIAIAIYTGIAAGSLTTNASSFKSSKAFLLSIFIPTILTCLFVNFEYHYYISFFLLIGLIGYLKGAQVIYYSIYKSAKTSLDNQLLVQQVIESNEKRIQAERNSMHSSKLATVGEMAAGIAHEINNPLAIISGNLEMVKLKLKKNSDSELNLDKYFNSCDKNVARISSLVKSLKRMSYEDNRAEIEKVNLKQIIDDAFSFTKEKVKAHRIDFSIDVDNQDRDVFCNGLHMSQVLLNLVNNAVHAIGTHDNPWIKISSYEDRDYIYIEVVDSGNGIPRHVAEKIFNPFFTTKDINSGTGLGLSLSRTMAKTSGGDLVLDMNSPNTRFILSLALRPQENKEAA